MDVREIKQTVRDLDSDLSGLKNIAKNILALYLSNQYSKKQIGSYLYELLGSVIKISGYDLKEIYSDLSEETTIPEIIITKSEPMEESVEVQTDEEPKAADNRLTIFASRLKTLRERNKLTTKELADMITVPYNTVYRWETRGSIPRQNTLEELAKLFNVPSQYLVGEGEE